MKFANLIPGATQLIKMGALPWFGGIALAAFLAGAGIAGYTGFKVAKAFYRGEALQAKLDLSKFEGSLAAERLEAKAREGRIMQAAKVNHEAEKESIAGVAAELRRLAAGVRVCTSQSTMRVSPAPAGPAQPVESGEPRPADIVLQELAAEFARRADSNAAAFNSLMERWEKLSPVDR